MTQITRLFDSPTQAQAAYDELKAQRFENVELLLPPGHRARPPLEELVQPLERAGIDRASAEHYAEGLKRGSAIVSVRAPFGSAMRASDILDRHGPGAAPEIGAMSSRRGDVGQIDATIPDRTAARGAAAAAGSRASEPTASAGRVSDAPRSTGPKTLSQMLGIPELIDSNTFFSGFPLLIRSTRPPNTKPPVPDSSLPAKQKPSASLVDDPAPVSNLLGLPVLSKNQQRRN
jgi:hypothetical protein